MKKLFCRYINAISTAVVFLFASQPALCEPPKEAIKLLQIHYFTGLNEVTIAKDAIRVENRGQMKFYLVARAPKWNVTLFRTDDKTYFSQPLSEFEKSGILSDLLVGSKERALDRAYFRRSTIIFNGHKAIRMAANASAALEDYLPLSEVLGCAPQIESIIYLLYKMPTNGGIPIRFVSRRSGKDWITGLKEEGNLQTEMDTIKMTSVKVPSSTFDPPSGYARAKSVREVVSGMEARGTSEEFLKAFTSNEKKERK